jgi:hypothetical protein
MALLGYAKRGGSESFELKLMSVENASRFDVSKFTFESCMSPALKLQPQAAVPVQKLRILRTRNKP